MLKIKSIFFSLNIKETNACGCVGHYRINSNISAAANKRFITCNTAIVSGKINRDTGAVLPCAWIRVTGVFYPITSRV